MSLLAAGGMSIGARLLQALLGKKQSRYEMSPQEQEIFDALMGAYRGDVPSSVTAPYRQEAHRLEQREAQYPGLRGAISGIKERKVFGPMGEAIKSYKLGAAGQAAGLAKGTGSMTMPTDWGETIGGMGGDIAFIMALMKAMKEDEGGDWFKNLPTHGLTGKRPV